MAFNLSDFLQKLPKLPGVYQFYDGDKKLLYVGKARQLKNRVSSYFQKSKKAARIERLVQKVNSIEIIITHSENEALLLESNLIKQFKPRYNVLLRDDKSYPYIFLSTEQKFPQLAFHRGSKKIKGRYFGPYPSVSAVREVLHLLHKLFLIRQCSDSFFNNRSRPCLQYQIKRCSAPCVGLINETDYQQSVDHAMLFLEGKDQQIIDNLQADMERVAAQKDYEQAAIHRDCIANLRRIQEKQYISGDEGDVDILVGLCVGRLACVQLLSIRHGRMLGGKAFYPKISEGTEIAEMLSAFLSQYYFDSLHSSDIPRRIISNIEIDEASWLENSLREQCQHPVKLVHKVRGEQARWLAMAATNAQNSLMSLLADKSTLHKQFAALQAALGLDSVPRRIECFDISHSMGEATVASCVVFDEAGARKSAYRRFNIAGITGGDDYAAMKQALMRRYEPVKAKAASVDGVENLPELILIDGGKGQLKQAEEVLEELGLIGIILVGVAKGEDRKPGLESLFLSSKGKPIHLAEDALALHLIQKIRDEAHRFAITGHRQRRDKRRKKSTLEVIPGVGSKRRKELLQHFGGLTGLKKASVEELAKVKGISKKLAQLVFKFLCD